MASSKPQISVVIPSYNRKDSVLTLLGDVFRQQGVDFEVIVVDDCSSDGSVEAVVTAFPQVIMLKNEKNGGPCVARNRGIHSAQAPIVVGLDSDVRVPDQTLFHRTIETFGRFPEASALALRVVEMDGKTDDEPRWCHPFPIKPVADQWVWSDYFSGTGYACRRLPMIEAGLFPEILYMHHEEVEIAYRMLDIGGSILHCPDLCVLHEPHPVADRGKIEIYYNPRNQVLLAAGIYPWSRLITFIVPRTSYQFLIALKNRHLGSYFKAIWDAGRLLRRRLSERRPLTRATLNRIRQLRRSPCFANRDVSPPSAARETNNPDHVRNFRYL